MWDAVAFLPQLLYIEDTVSMRELCLVSRVERLTVGLWRFVGAKAEELLMSRTADRRARRKRFMLKYPSRAMERAGTQGDTARGFFKSCCVSRALCLWGEE